MSHFGGKGWGKRSSDRVVPDKTAIKTVDHTWLKHPSPRTVANEWGQANLGYVLFLIRLPPIVCLILIVESSNSVPARFAWHANFFTAPIRRGEGRGEGDEFV